MEKDSSSFFEEDEEDGYRLDDDIVIPISKPLVRIDDVLGKPRLIVHSIVTVNFKSYAGRVVMGPFNPNFTCVIGANGSGKSNLIDSLLFVFGSRANRIRSSGLRGLIHNSKNFKNLTECSVEIHFVEIKDMEDDTYEEIPKSEFVISRTALKDGTSYYKINDKKVRFKDVSEKLATFDIDSTYNRFLILQGEVERISLMKPKAINDTDPPGMLEYIEDVIGTVKYKVPLEKLNVKVQELQDERNYRVEVLKKLTVSLDALQQPMERAIDFLTTENNICHLKNKQYQHQLYATKNHIENKTKQKTELTQALAEYEENKKILQKKRKNIEMETKDYKKKCEVFLGKIDTESEMKNKLQQRLKDLEKEIPSLQRKQKQLKTDQKNASEEVNRSENMIVSKEKEIENNEQTLSCLTKKINTLENSLEKIKSTYLDTIKPFEEQKNDYIKQESAAKEILLEKTESVNSAKAAYDSLQKPFLEESEKLVQLQDRHVNSVHGLETKTGQLRELQSVNKVKSEKLVKAQQELPKVVQRETQLQSEVRKVRDKLEKQEEVRNAERKTSNVLKFIMKLKTDGIAPGIIGRLGDLGAIDSKYDIAVSTGCSKLDSIIVDTVETSAQCIKHLKQSKAGRANFIILNKLQNFEQRMTLSVKNFSLPRLFDLIEVQNERFRPAFYHVLRDTLVADNIQQANLIAYGKPRRRVVTLQGQVIEISGTVTAGGSGKNAFVKGKMGNTLTLSTQDTETLKEQLKKLELDLSKVRSIKFQLEKDASSLSLELATLSVQIQQLAVDAQTLSDDIPKLENEIDMQKKKIQKLKPHPVTLSQLYKKIEKANDDLAQAEKVLASFVEKIESINQRIKQKHDIIMKQPETKLKEDKENEKTIMSSNNTLRMEITKLQMKIKQLHNTITTKEKTADDVKKKLEADVNEKQIVQRNFTASEEQLNQLQEELGEIQAIRKEKENELGERNKEHDIMYMDHVIKQKEVAAIDETLKQLRNSISLLREKMGKLKLNVIPNVGKVKTEPDESNTTESASKLITYTDEKIIMLDKDELDKALEKEEQYLKKLSPDLSAIDEYIEKKNKYTKAEDEYKEVCERRNFYRKWLEQTTTNRLKEFKTGFSLIARKVKELYQFLTLGGDADLELKDSLNPFAEGIELSVRPPNKSWKTVDKLSGGEKTLASLTIVFALHHYKMTPFYFMDEIDAALDDMNSFIVGNYIKKQTKMAQFIVISLRTTMFQDVSQVIGIFKINDCTNTAAFKSKKLNKLLQMKRQLESNKTNQKRKYEEAADTDEFNGSK